MGVRDLRDGQQGEQNQAHDGDDRQSRQLCASLSCPMCLKWGQTSVLRLRIHRFRCAGSGNV
jgi:hypothetical protein